MEEHDPPKFLLFDGKAVLHQQAYGTGEIGLGEDEVEITMQAGDASEQRIYTPASIKPHRYAGGCEQVKSVEHSRRVHAARYPLIYWMVRL
jgi:hypothetical protein